MTGGGDRGVWARGTGFIGMGIRREEEKKQPQWARVGGAPSPQASPDQVPPGALSAQTSRVISLMGLERWA